MRIEITEIDEFRKCKLINRSHIKNEVIKKIRNLDERSELEPFIRSIISDPNETPHGPNEIADIITEHIHMGGISVKAAFVIKGKAFDKAKSSNVISQIIRPLTTISDLQIIVLVVVGNIYDDLRRDLANLAIKYNVRYLIIDVVDVARLLISNGIICPEDGYIFNEKGICLNGHRREWKYLVDDNIETLYETIYHNDCSYGLAKRYKVYLLLHGYLSRNQIKKVILHATNKFRRRKYHSSDLLKQYWCNEDAHVVWLFIAKRLSDIEDANWVCMTSWVDPNLPDNLKPQFNGNDFIEDIIIQWNEKYYELQNLYSKYHGTKEEILYPIEELKRGLDKLTDIVESSFTDLITSKISEENFIQIMENVKKELHLIDEKQKNLPLPPFECRDLYNIFNEYFVVVSNMFLLYSNKGLKLWPKNNREWLMKSAINDSKRLAADLEHELKKAKR